ncbi:hypothetical protein TNCV_3243861 [Trichonephila clavipes]|nr:hypothetical protein TNCV_3243861 [Trichonephila clavipes]
MDSTSGVTEIEAQGLCSKPKYVLSVSQALGPIESLGLPGMRERTLCHWIPLINSPCSKKVLNRYCNPDDFPAFESCCSSRHLVSVYLHTFYTLGKNIPTPRKRYCRLMKLQQYICIEYIPRKLISLFSAAPYRRIPIAASNFDAQFPPQRARRHLSSDDSNLYLDLILPIAPKPNRHSRDLLHAV